MKYDAGMKTNKLELYQIHRVSSKSKRWEIVRMDYLCEGRHGVACLYGGKSKKSQINSLYNLNLSCI